ncbi:MAG: Flp pilus assembly complex ATPase component TadA [Clostridia bacterium]|nr:Flp pilus assembly complex ATPase component TadA [Clostridia bacterium]MBQ7363948.1 Flp pilus assembly complex ATPase component TadA [Clostridia bacterium]
MSTQHRDKLSSAVSVIGRHFPAIAREIEGISRGGGRIEEIRLRRFGRSSVRIAGRDMPLAEQCAAGMEALLIDVCGGSVYAHRDSIADGYVTMECGVRVGVVGRASYDGALVGVRDISALVFRIPGGECSFAVEMYRAWLRMGSCGALIISPPAEGKTTALSSLLAEIGKGTGKRTVFVDERCETDFEALSFSGVDVMRGYKRARGLEIAVRTISPEIIACDEIYSKEDADAIIAAHGTGVRIIASAHAENERELGEREVLSRLIKSRVFGILFIVRRRGGEFFFSSVKL